MVLPPRSALVAYNLPQHKPKGWLLVELLLVTVHVCMCLLPPVPIIFLIVWMQTVYSVRLPAWLLFCSAVIASVHG